MPVAKIGVVGAGTMGSGIAQVAAMNGYEVVIRDVEQSYLESGLAKIRKNLDRLVSKGVLEENRAGEIMGRITPTLDLKDLADADIVIEAIVEDMAIKKELFKELDKLCKPEAILATNTSGLSITEIASATNRAGQVAGMHFFNPVPVLKLVEVIKGDETGEDTTKEIIELAQKLGKEPIEVKEAPLFIVNRILIPMINEAVFVLMEGVASAEDIDRAMKLGANHPIGPLALADLIGLDIVLDVIETLYRETGDSKYRPCPLLRKKVRAGHLGRKAGQGFYEY